MRCAIVLVAFCLSACVSPPPIVTTPSPEDEQRTALLREEAELDRTADELKRDDEKLPKRIETDEQAQQVNRWLARADAYEAQARDLNRRISQYNRNLERQQDRDLQTLRVLSDIEANDAAIEADRAAAKATEAAARVLNSYP